MRGLPADIEARKGRWRALMRPGAGPGFVFQIDVAEPPPPAPPPLTRANAAARVEWAWRLYQHQCRQAALVADDRLPFLTNVTGTEIFAEAFGCRVHHPPGSNPCAVPLVRTPAEADRLRVPDLSTSSLAYLFAIADELRRRGGPDCLMKPVDTQTPMDIAAQIWDKTEFLAALVEAPDAVLGLAFKARRLLTAFFDEWFRRYGTEHIAHYPDYLMTGGITVSEDEIGVVTPEMFNRFFRDELAELSARFGGLGVHCCANSRHQWANLKALPGLRLLNLDKPPAEPPAFIRDAYAFFGNSVVQMHGGWQPPGAPPEVVRGLPFPARVVWEFRAPDAARAAAWAERINTLRDARRASRPPGP